MTSFNPEPFSVHFTPEEISALKEKIKSADAPKPTYEGTRPDFGVTSEWMKEAKKRWSEDFDWEAQQLKINSFSQFRVSIPQPSSAPLKIHFVHEPSPNPSARPLLLCHGWPGSYVEFLALVTYLKETKEFHIVVPSMPGYAFSDPPPVDKDFLISDVARICNDLMVGLGYKKYAVQAGDWGMRTARVLAKNHSQNVVCVLANAFFGGPPKTVFHSILPGYCHDYSLVDLVARMTQRAAGWILPNPATFGLTESDLEGVETGRKFVTEGSGYMLEHRTRPSTIIHVVASSPVALLAWVGEKFVGWSDETPSWDEMLTTLTIWALTDTFSSSIYNYRTVRALIHVHFGGGTPLTALPPLNHFWADVQKEGSTGDPEYYIKQPTGYSHFAKELFPSPRSWAAQTCRLTWYKWHPDGGHFAAWEKPEVLGEDVREFVKSIKWPTTE